MPTAATSFAFSENEKVLAYHGPLIHEATVSKQEAKDSPDGRGKIRLYLLTYNGYSQHWDEWVPESRMLKHTADSLALQKERIKEFQRAHKRKQKQEAGGSNPSAGAGAAAVGPPAKKARAAESTSEDSLASELRESLRLPHGMKLKLIEDWERITRERKLVPIPAQTSIAELLDDFQLAKARRTTHERLYGEVSDGIRAYFNQALPTLLLYKYERRQYQEQKQKDKKAPVDIYGAEHLLRLFVKLPELLAKCNMQREHITVLVAKLTELLKFLQSNKQKYFVTDYEAPTEEYVKHALGTE